MHKRWMIVVGLMVGCGGAQSKTEPAAVAPEPAAEEFGPGLATHSAPIEDVTRDATKVLAASYEVAPSEAPGVVTTAWASPNEKLWPGAQTRVVVEVLADRVIVRLQCRHESGSCVRTVPVAAELPQTAQSIADEIAAGRAGDLIIAKMRAFKDDVCACADAACVEQVERSMMEWAMKNMDKLKNMKPTRAQDEEADRIEDAMDACKERIAPSPPAATVGPSEPLTPLPPGGTGSKPCDEYLATFDTIVENCADRMGPALDAMIQSRNAQVEAFAEWSKLDKKSKKAAVDAAKEGCTAARDALRQSAESMGCTL